VTSGVPSSVPRWASPRVQAKIDAIDANLQKAMA
jgi:hypothetical protein